MSGPAVIKVVEKLSFTIAEAVLATGISRSTIWEKISAGQLRAKRNGKTTLILRDDLVTFLTSLPDWRS